MNLWLLPKSLAISLVCICFFDQSLAQDSNSIKDCRKINAYRSQGTLYSVFSNPSGSTTSCIPVDGEKECSRFIRKRTRPYTYVVIGRDSLIDLDRVHEFNDALLKTLLDINHATGARGFIWPLAPRDARERVSGIIVIDENEYRENPKEYIKKYITSPTPLGAEVRKELFEDFISTDKIHCASNFDDDPSGEIKVSTIWIKSSIPTDDIGRCLREGMAGAMGIFTAGDSQQMRPPSNASKDSNFIDDLDLLKLLYHWRIGTGVSGETAISALSQAADDLCSK